MRFATAEPSEKARRTAPPVSASGVPHHPPDASTVLYYKIAKREAFFSFPLTARALLAITILRFVLIAFQYYRAIRCIFKRTTEKPSISLSSRLRTPLKFALLLLIQHLRSYKKREGIPPMRILLLRYTRSI